MNEVIKQLYERKSMRVFEDREISAEDKAMIFQAAAMAASAGNQQLYTIIDVTSQTLKDRLAISCDNQPFIATGKMVQKAILAKEKYNVVLNYNNSEEAAKKIKKELEEENIKIEIFKADVSKREEVKELVKFTLEKYKNIDVLINNAGIDQIKPFMDITDKDWDNIMQVNLNSVFYCSQEVLDNMIHNKNGCIINISSIWGITGASCEVHYSASKAAIDGLTKALAKSIRGLFVSLCNFLNTLLLLEYFK